QIRGAFCNQWAERAQLLAFSSFPVQAVLLACGTGKLARELTHAVAIAIFVTVDALCFHIGAQYVDRIAFVAADATVFEFIYSLLRAKTPAITRLHDRNRHGPGLVANHKDSPIGARV